MKEPQKIRLTDSPQSSKKVKLIRLESNKHFGEENDEDHTKNNTQSIQQLESDETN